MTNSTGRTELGPEIKKLENFKRRTHQRRRDLKTGAEDKHWTLEG